MNFKIPQNSSSPRNSCDQIKIRSMRSPKFWLQILIAVISVMILITLLIYVVVISLSLRGEFGIYDDDGGTE